MGALHSMPKRTALTVLVASVSTSRQLSSGGARLRPFCSAVRGSHSHSQVAWRDVLLTPKEAEAIAFMTGKAAACVPERVGHIDISESSARRRAFRRSTSYTASMPRGQAPTWRSQTPPNGPEVNMTGSSPCWQDAMRLRTPASLKPMGPLKKRQMAVFQASCRRHMRVGWRTWPVSPGPPPPPWTRTLSFSSPPSADVTLSCTRRPRQRTCPSACISKESSLSTAQSL
mmetsp:Transcript_18969/g.59640  ORF Transcript_18969/g.59640 Transcript_18969/m.59640 type:complete len:229 (-) Transcript_18969:229-915(-)